MQKAENVEEFVKRVNAAKKTKPTDVPADQDLSIAVMNLISIEEHLVFSGAKTGKNAYYDLIQNVREMRKNLLQRLIPSYEGEVWCISKHLLASSMRLMEVGTKQQSLGHEKEAYALFRSAYDVYCLFWDLNAGKNAGKNLKWPALEPEQVKQAMQETQQILQNGQTETVEQSSSLRDAKDSGVFSKIKKLVHKVVKYSIE
ncbi:MAG: hypothetical protein J6Y91_04355 [Alphaproteobacteria bacterium]|nr:hypothetical protein [Alphaproteobacteria bacterium]